MFTKSKLLTAALLASIACSMQASDHVNHFCPSVKTIVKGGKIKAELENLERAQEIAKEQQAQRKAKAQQTDEEYKQVTVKLNYDPDVYFASPIIQLINVETGEEYEGFAFETPEAVIDVLPGVYMTSMSFCDNVSGPQRIVIKESIVVKGDTTVILDPEEATNLQERKLYTHNGEPLKLEVWKYFDEEPWQEKVEAGNASMAYVATSIYYDGVEILMNMGGSYNDRIDDNGEVFSTLGWLNYYINDVSDKVTAMQYGVIFADDYSSVDVFLFENQSVQGPHTYVNNPDDFVLFDASYAQEPYASIQAGVGVAWQLNGEPSHFIETDMWQDFGNRYYIGKTNSTNLNNAEIFIIPSRQEYDDMENWTQYNSYLAPVYNQDGVLRHAVYPYATNGAAYARNTYNGRTIQPHTYFSFSLDQEGGKAFDNVPVLVSTNSFFAAEEVWDANFGFEINYLGNYGEQTQLGAFLGTVEYKKDGELIAANSQEMQEFLWSIYDNGIESAWGEYEINATYPVSIEGIEGGNTTTMKFSFQNGVDVNSPTVQMLQLRKEDGTVTTRFVEGESVQLSVAGGDYVYDNTYPRYHNYVPASIKVEYSPYKADQWMDVAVEANPELLDVPGMGDTYQGTICDLPASSNNWYDLRLTVVDAAGNSQQQTLTAAFKVDSAVGLSELKEQSNDATIYTLQGQKAAKQLSAGFYIANGKKIVKM